MKIVKCFLAAIIVTSFVACTNPNSSTVQEPADEDTTTINHSGSHTPHEEAEDTRVINGDTLNTSPK